MKKIIHFGCLRMLFMNMGRDKAKFNAYLKDHYTPEEQERIRKAFLTISTENETPASVELAKEEG